MFLLIYIPEVCLFICSVKTLLFFPFRSAAYNPIDLQSAFDRLKFPCCYLCSVNKEVFDDLIALEVHFFRTHVRHCIASFPNRLSLVCKLKCQNNSKKCSEIQNNILHNNILEYDQNFVNDSNSDAGSERHFHCPSCSFLSCDRPVVECHLADFHSLNKPGLSDEIVKSRVDISLIHLQSPSFLRELLKLEADADTSFL